MPTLLLALTLLQPQASGLRIVVLEGEDAVNIVQQKTAVRPLVEVRDRNNLPVSGASVTFTVGSGQPAAFAGGAQTITVTTNASGQAAASGFSATGPGAVQIQVQAAHLGQTATAAISQTNFATAAAAAAAGAAAGGSAAGTAGAAAGGGGISATTIGIVAAAVGGGAVAATQLTNAGSGDGDGKTYASPYSGQMTVTVTTVGSGTCVQAVAVSGTISMTFAEDGSIHAQLDLRAPRTAVSGGAACVSVEPSIGANPPVSGSSNLSFTVTNGPGTNETRIVQTAVFNGSQQGDAVNGTLSYTETWSGNAPGRPGNVISGGGTVSIPITMR